VFYVEAHGTSTQAGDPLEMESVRSIFSRKTSTLSYDGNLYIGSIKGNLGHCETAAGVVGLLKVLTMIKHSQVPPQANYNKLNPKIALLEPDGLAIARSLRGWNVPFRAALVNSYGAAGSNCALLCCEMPSQHDFLKKNSEEISLPTIISATSEQSLLQNAEVLSAYLRKHGSDINLSDAAYTLKERRKRLRFLATIKSRSVQDAASQLESLQSASIFQQMSRPPRPVVLVFSGQFDNKVGLDKAVYDSVPAFRYYIDACDQGL
jgi:acyl transferase domain-containing protein